MNSVLRSFAVLLLCSTPLAYAQDKTLHVYNWADYIEPSILTDFEKETGIKVVYENYTSNEELDAKLREKKTAYDVIIPGAHFLNDQIKAGLIQKLDKNKLTNIGNLWTAIQWRLGRYPEAINDYSVNYMWGTTSLVYDARKISTLLPGANLKTWDLLFDPQNAAKLAQCGIGMLDAPDEVLATLSNYLGIDPNKATLAEKAQIEHALLAIQPYIKRYFSDAAVIDALIKGDVCITMIWSALGVSAVDTAQQKNSKTDLKYIIPKEGALVFFDQMAIPANAPHPELAHQFINYMLRPEVIAKSTNSIRIANGNKAAQKLVDAKILANPAIYPDDNTLRRLFILSPVTPELKATYDGIWKKFRQ